MRSKSSMRTQRCACGVPYAERRSSVGRTSRCARFAAFISWENKSVCPCAPRLHDASASAAAAVPAAAVPAAAARSCCCSCCPLLLLPAAAAARCCCCCRQEKRPCRIATNEHRDPSSAPGTKPTAANSLWVRPAMVLAADCLSCRVHKHLNRPTAIIQ